MKGVYIDKQKVFSYSKEEFFFFAAVKAMKVMCLCHGRSGKIIPQGWKTLTYVNNDEI